MGSFLQADLSSRVPSYSSLPSINFSGGPQWSLMSLLKARLHSKLLLASCSHYWVLIMPGLISLDFVTGLAPSDGNTVILTVVDWFSKTAHFIPLPKLPSAKETAQLMVQHVFRIHGLPVDMVSDWCSCLSSGRHSAPFLGRRPAYHPESIPKLTISQSKPTKTWRPP